MKFKCRKSEVQGYECQVCCSLRWKSEHKLIGFDKCLANELFDLWDRGIITNGSCCGQHTGMIRRHAYISVEKEFISEMEKLGYRKDLFIIDPEKEGTFIPKTKFLN